jgi:CheY-like chemotaxis protein
MPQRDSGVALNKRDYILLVEDEEQDALLLQFAFDRAGIEVPMVVASDGSRAQAHLERLVTDARQQDCPAPSLVITDIKMPNMNGFELVEWIRKEPELKDLPVVVLSSSNHDSDRQRAMALKIQGYFVKPCSFEKLVALVREWKTTLVRDC